MASIFRRTLAVTRTHLETARERSRLSVPVGSVDLGDLRRTAPISRVFGRDRGTRIDDYYVEGFMSANHESITGHVLQVAHGSCSEDGVEAALPKDSGQASATGSGTTTVLQDLSDLAEIGDGAFDCVILDRVLQSAFELRKAVTEVRRIVKPGGTVLCTCDGISRISRDDVAGGDDYWRLTSASLKRLFDDEFGPANVVLTTFGNVLSATAFLEGLAAEELEQPSLDEYDQDYQVVVAVKATKARP